MNMVKRCPFLDEECKADNEAVECLIPDHIDIAVYCHLCLMAKVLKEVKLLRVTGLG